MLDVRRLINFRENFTKELRSLPTYKTFEAPYEVATSDLAQETYGDANYYWIVNEYNKRVPTLDLERGEIVKLPRQEDVIILIAVWDIKSRDKESIVDRRSLL